MIYLKYKRVTSKYKIRSTKNMLGREGSLGTNTFNVSAIMFHRKQDLLRLLIQN